MKLHSQYFGIFIALSLAIHAAVLTVIFTDHTPLLTENNTSLLDIELMAPQVVSAKLKAQRTRPITLHNDQINPAVLPQAAADENNFIDKSPQESVTVTNQINNLMQNTAMADAIQEKIMYEFSRYFYYPDAARRRNRQGDVILQFTLLPDGHLNQIRIHKSSGFKSLDDAAVHALQQVKPQQELAVLTDASMLHVLPVSYRLMNPL